MPRRSAGLLLFRRLDGEVSGPLDGEIEVLLVHPGGPFWARRDDGAWSIPKGEVETGDDAWATARREFGEELGIEAPDGPGIDLGEVTQSGGKRVTAWALAGDLDVDRVVSNTFELEWPPRSGQTRTFPEVDRAAWFTPDGARVKLLAAQVAFVDRLLAALADATT